MRVIETFRVHVQSVQQLMNFDRDVLDVAIASLRELRTALIKHHHLDNPHLTAERTLKLLEGIRKHDSLRHRYKTIFNQALVLLVSYFGSSIHDLFCHGVAAALAREDESPLLREHVRITFRELRDVGFNLRDVAPDLLVQAKDISFQDMQSIARAFKDYLDITIEKNESVNDLILGQACRHVIVHAGSIADDRLLHQIANAKPRRVKLSLLAGEAVEFSDTEVTLVAESMERYIDAAAAKVSERYEVNL